MVHAFLICFFVVVVVVVVKIQYFFKKKMNFINKIELTGIPPLVCADCCASSARRFFSAANEKE